MHQEERFFFGKANALQFSPGKAGEAAGRRCSAVTECGARTARIPQPGCAPSSAAQSRAPPAPTCGSRETCTAGPRAALGTAPDLWAAVPETAGAPGDPFEPPVASGQAGGAHFEGAVGCSTPKGHALLARNTEPERPIKSSCSQSSHNTALALLHAES